MADPLSISAGVIAVVTAAAQTVNGILEFYKTTKNRDRDVNLTIKRLEDLSSTLQLLQEVLRDRVFDNSEEKIINNIESNVADCADVIDELSQELAKFRLGTTNTSTKA